MFAVIDWTAVLIALCGVVTAAIGGAVAIRIKRLEIRAAEAARRAESAARRAKESADWPAVPPPQLKRPPDPPCV